MGALADEYIRLRPDTSTMSRDLKREGGKAGKTFGSSFGASLKGALGAAAVFKIISGAAGFLAEANKEARESQKVGATTTQIIKTTGGAAKISAKQVGTLTTAISNKTGVDDEAIQSGSNLLLTFKNVRNETGKGSKIFDRATQAAVDLSAAGFGSVEGSSKMLGKALNDPLKGISALSRAGVTFTDGQKKQIKAMVESGDVLGAQKIIMKEVESQVGGVAEASATAGEKMKVAWDNSKEAIGTALLPLVDEFATLMTKHVIPVIADFAEWLGKKIPGAISIVKGAIKGFSGALRTGFSEQDTVTPFEKIGLGIRGVYDMLIKGDFSKAFATAFGVEEDAPIVDLLLDIHDGLTDVARFVRDEVVPALGDLADFITTVVLPNWLNWYKFLFEQFWPIIKRLVKFFAENIVPALSAVVGFIRDEVVPGFLAIVETVKGLLAVVVPIIAQIVGFIVDKFIEFKPQIMEIWGSVKEIIVGALFIIKSVIGIVTAGIKIIWDRWGADILRIIGIVFKLLVGIIGGVMKVIAGIIKLAVALIKGDWSGAWDAIKQIFAGVWKIIKAILVAAWEVIKVIFGGAFRWVKEKWDAFWAAVKKTGKDAITSVKDTINDVLTKIKDGFKTGVDAIGTAWDKIKDKTKEPVKFVIETVLDNGILGAVRSISKLVGFEAGKDVHVALPSGWASGTSQVLPGYTPGHDVHRFFSATGGVLDLSGGEGIARPELVKAIGKGRWDAANKAARNGRVDEGLHYLGGFAKGSSGIGAAEAYARSIGIRSIGTYAGHHPSAARARDFMTSSKSQGDKMAEWLWVNRKSIHLWYEIWWRRIRSMTREGAGWQPYGRSNPHTDHVHGSWYPAGLSGIAGALTAAGAGIAGVIDIGKYTKLIDDAMDKLKDITGTGFGEMIAGAPKMIVQAIKDKISSLASSFMGAIGGAFTSITGGSNRSIGHKMMLQRWGEDQWPPLNSLWTRESGWRTTAKNPSSGAYGIPQSLPGSKMASAGSDWRTNPSTQIKWGLGYIADRYGNPAGAWAHSQRTGWYDQGGILPPGLTLAINNTGRDELVTPMPKRGTAGARKISQSRPIKIELNLGQDLRYYVQGVIDDNDEFRATMGRLS